MRVEECEERIARASGRHGAVVCSRATVGLAGALKALELPRGSGVVVPVMVCSNVAHAVKGAGLRPVFADVEVQEGGIGMSVASGERVVDEGCRVLLAVPLFGGEVDEEELSGFATRHGLVIVEDAAQRGFRILDFGLWIDEIHRRRRSERRGHMGVCSVVSFGAGKVGDAGGGGAVVSDDEGLLRNCELQISDFGLRKRVDYGRIVEVLERLEEEVEGRWRRAREYRRRLRMEGVEHVGERLPVWKYSVLVEDKEVRDRVTRRLVESGVEATNLYPPLSAWFGGVEGEGYDGAWGIWNRIVNLPLRWDGAEEEWLGIIERIFEGSVR